MADVPKDLRDLKDWKNLGTGEDGLPPAIPQPATGKFAGSKAHGIPENQGQFGPVKKEFGGNGTNHFKIDNPGRSA